MLYEGFFQGTLRCRCDMNMRHDSKNSRDEEQSKKKRFLWLCRIAPFPMTSLRFRLMRLISDIVIRKNFWWFSSCRYGRFVCLEM